MMIRKFRKSDLRRILEIEKEAFPKSPYDIFTFSYFYRIYPDFFLVHEEREITGYIIFNPEDGHIASIAVHPDYRRRGIGTKLVEEVFKRTGRKAYIEVRESNKGAQEFYKKIGFRKKGIISKYYGSEDAIVMVIP
ncbi:MAG: ribosomal protein S18-alanine N-acetyltransferase [Candidatus Syntropharchaeia archaeon]